jgi:acid phosphatase family membrane protein YuiD
MLMQIKTAVLIMCISAAFCAGTAQAGSGPLGIDSKMKEDDHGIWLRRNQKGLEAALIGGEILGALWEGRDTRLGKTFYQAIDASIVAGVSTEVMKRLFGRVRPSATDDPNQWFQRGGRSFPSGEVGLAAAVVTPFVLEYGHDHPAVYALELIPLYDAEARMKTHGHWQTDVLAGWAVGTAAGYYAHSRSESFTVGVLPRGITVGWKTKF